MTRARIKQGKASLIGGIAVGVAVLVLWLASRMNWRRTALWALRAGVLVASGVAVWIRLADL